MSTRCVVNLKNELNKNFTKMGNIRHAIDLPDFNSSSNKMYLAFILFTKLEDVSEIYRHCDDVNMYSAN